MDKLQEAIANALKEAGIEATEEQLSKIVQAETIKEAKNSFLNQGRMEVKTKFEKLEKGLLEKFGYSDDLGDRDEYISNLVNTSKEVETLKQENETLRKNKDGLPEAEKKRYLDEIEKQKSINAQTVETLTKVTIDNQLLPLFNDAINPQESLLLFKNAHKISAEDGKLKIQKSDGTEYYNGIDPTPTTEIVSSWFGERSYLKKSDGNGGSGGEPPAGGSDGTTFSKSKMTDEDYNRKAELEAAGKTVTIID